MTKYILKRVGMAIITLFIITFLLFVLVRILPGNPFPSEKMSDEQIAAKRLEMGLDDPLPVQFGRYMSGVLKGDFGNGTGLYYGVPISTVLGNCIANSFKIGGLAILFGTLVGLVLGIVAALNRDKFWDVFCTVFSIIGVCLPSYVFLILVIEIFSYGLGVLPVFFDKNQFFLSSILPAVSMSLLTISTISRFTRNEMVEVMDSDFVLLAESKGLYGKAIVRKHVLRNALIPIVTVLAPLIVDLLTGALVVEKIYGIDGIGKLMVLAITDGPDYNYILALSILYSALYICAMLIVDVLYGLLDPRIRVAKKRGEH